MDFGMGDVLTLIEKAQTSMDEKKARELQQKMKENSFDLNDLMDQLGQMKNMGSIQQILSMIPGLGAKLKDVQVDDKQFYSFEAIIQSMTPQERAKPSIINPSRKRRIAAGCGQKVEDVNRLLRQFDQMQKMMKQFGNFKKGKRRMMPPGLPF